MEFSERQKCDTSLFLSNALSHFSLVAAVMMCCLVVELSVLV